MECTITECFRYKDCGILDITKKIPENKNKCSYFKTEPKKEENVINIEEIKKGSPKTSFRKNKKK
ncbi:MAG TPA: hypothetical protein PLI22_03310 [Caldisericia bacterium]|jgi:hypothetical protein|nr:hypothetical protein [Caldisericia bacterium]